MIVNKKSYDSVKARLEEILVEVRDKNTPLERSLDLYEEAISLGMSATELIDTQDAASAAALAEKHAQAVKEDEAPVKEESAQEQK